MKLTQIINNTIEIINNERKAMKIDTEFFAQNSDVTSWMSVTDTPQILAKIKEGQTIQKTLQDLSYDGILLESQEHQEAYDAQVNLIRNWVNDAIYGGGRISHGPDVYRVKTTSRKNEQMIIIDEVRVSEFTTGHSLKFESWYYNTSTTGYFKKKWPFKLVFVNSKVDDKPTRVMWANTQNGAIQFGKPFSLMVELGLIPGFDNGHNDRNGIASFYKELLEKVVPDISNILPITKWIGKPVVEDHESLRLQAWGTRYFWGIYPHGVTQSDIYWIGDETSVKKILNKAFRHPHGVTKKAFGDINMIQESKDLNMLRWAIFVCRALRGFSPAILEEMTLPLVYQGPMVYQGQINEWNAARLLRFVQEAGNGSLAINEFRYFFDKFGYKAEFAKTMFAAERAEILDPDRGTARFRETSFAISSLMDTVRMMKMIRSNRVKKEIIRQARQFDSINAVHDYVVTEYNRIKVGKKVFKTKLIKAFVKDHNKEICEGITLYVPQDSLELADWGRTQSNCIGSYTDRIMGGNTIIIGFKDESNAWLGHAEIQNVMWDSQTFEMHLNQLLGKHNAPLAPENRRKIVEYLQNRGVQCQSYLGSENRIPLDEI